MRCTRSCQNLASAVYVYVFGCMYMNSLSISVTVLSSAFGCMTLDSVGAEISAKSYFVLLSTLRFPFSSLLTAFI